MGRRVRVAAALVICLLGLAACGLGDRPAGLPDPPEAAEGASSGVPIAPQPPLPSTQEVRGPADIDVKEFYFEETGQQTLVNLERSPLRTTPDLSYDHFTGLLAPVKPTTVSLYKKDSWLAGEPDVRSDYPSEQQCNEPEEGWKEEFGSVNLESTFSIYCIKTADGSFGFLYIKPLENRKPDAYYVYSYIWIR